MNLVKKLRGLLTSVQSMESRFDDIHATCGRALANMNKGREAPLSEFEFKVFSQWGEDGIIQRLIDVTPIANQTFIEFGIESFKEANCRFLMVNNNWSGFVIDGSEKNIATLRSRNWFWKYDLKAESAFITAENINEILAASGFDADLGLLSVDIDGVDYWVLKAVKDFNPRIIIVEYNAVFGAERAVSVPYDPSFARSAHHHSNLYFGASLAAFDHLLSSRGYALVGTNTAGGNAFFIRADVLKLEALSVANAFNASKFRESRDDKGLLTHLRGSKRLQEISGLPVVNVVTGEIERL